MLSFNTLKNLKPDAKSYKKADSGGLYIEVMPTGAKIWRLKYRFQGKEKRLTFGPFPDVSLVEAREYASDAKRLLRDNIDPSAARQEARAAEQVEMDVKTFEAVATEWLENNRPAWSVTHFDKIEKRLLQNVYPALGECDIKTIRPTDVIKVIRRIEERGVGETTERALNDIVRVFRFAVAHEYCENNPARDLTEIKKKKPRTKHYAAQTTPTDFARVLKAIDLYEGRSASVQSMLRLLPLVFVRPGELRGMKWADVDFEKAEWKYFITKTRTEHLVPLSDQAIAILQHLNEVHRLADDVFVFPSPRSRLQTLSENAINVALRALGIDADEQTGHGFRASARTLLAEELGSKVEAIEHQLAHRVPDTLGEAYNRTKYLKERREMMQKWADYCDQLKKRQ